VFITKGRARGRDGGRERERETHKLFEELPELAHGEKAPTWLLFFCIRLVIVPSPSTIADLAPVHCPLLLLFAFVIDHVIPQSFQMYIATVLAWAVVPSWALEFPVEGKQLAQKG